MISNLTAPWHTAVGDKIQNSGTLTHFTLHLLSDSRVSDSSPLSYLRERTSELDSGAFLHCKDSEGLLRGFGLWYCESWGIGETEKVKPDSTTERCFL